MIRFMERGRRRGEKEGVDVEGGEWEKVERESDNGGKRERKSERGEERRGESKRLWKRTEYQERYELNRNVRHQSN
jgi:hypothetical protein